MFIEDYHWLTKMGTDESWVVGNVIRARHEHYLYGIRVVRLKEVYRSRNFPTLAHPKVIWLA